MIDFIILQGEKCNKCDTITHVYCLENYARNHGGLGCPNCHHLVSRHTDSSNFFLLFNFIFSYVKWFDHWCL